MARALVEFAGGYQLRKTLRAAGDDLSRLKALHREVGEIVADGARQRTPRRRGRLVGSIRVSPRQTGVSIRAGRKAIPYAGPVHWGWPARGIGQSLYLTDAAKASEPRWVGVYARGVVKILDQVKGT
ncbi:hypothetical protein [Arthrobacter sp. UM1]|uniref:hypothetical protein n=1 Tax=Arthrobacter sp. UM1 TaxID=2766776 RepID=UPI001CF63CA4|nr:hypothetical protein [Arthrobacter sp. UM1]MCB4209163.1 HK97 gp10 family phage protein [Arthrobacter sp. UM1]